MKLLQHLCSIHAPSGEEFYLRNFLLDYVETNRHTWKTKPRVLYGPDFKDCLLLIFGRPRTAIYAHTDSVGFTVRYGNELIPIGSPHAETGDRLVGKDGIGSIECVVKADTEKDTVEYQFDRQIERGASLTFRPDFNVSDGFIHSPYLDNRLGVRCALEIAETLENGVIAFTTGEEHSGGSVELISKFLFEKMFIRQALISDITWITEGVTAGSGVAISLRDSKIPRRVFVDRIIEIARSARIKYQLEVESSGSSDGGIIQKTPYPIDWCFVGAPGSGIHSPNEKVSVEDYKAMVNLYKTLMKEM